MGEFMNKFAKVAMLASALFIPQVANATHAPPSGLKTGTNVYVEKGINFLCNASINISGGSATVALTPGDPLCSVLQFNNMPYTMTMSASHLPNGRHLVTFHGVDVTTISAGDCAGNLTAEWDGTTLWVDAILPKKTAGNDCLVIGAVS